jgi:hypothetical protein
MKVAFASPPSARDCRVAAPISSQDSIRNSSPKPVISLSSNGRTASGVLSRPVIPVPPVTSTTATAGSAIQPDITARTR